MAQWQGGGPGGPGGQVQFAYPPLTPMVKRLILANVVAFAVYVGLGFAGPDRLGADRWLLLNPQTWKDTAPLVPIWQLVTYGFLHDGMGLMHIFFNMLTLYFLGGRVEGVIGERRFLVHYLIAIVLGGIAHLAIAPLLGGGGPALGASGACVAMIVAAAVMAPHSIIYLLVFPVKLWVAAAALVAIDLFSAVIALQGAGTGGTAIVIHLAGAAYGYIATKRRWLWWDPIAVAERKRAVRQEEQRVSDSERMDALLSKISKDGLGSLSAKEREFLKRQSEKGR